MAKYRKKPVAIEAVQWTGLNHEEIKAFCGGAARIDIIDTAWEVGKGVPVSSLYIDTLEGVHHASIGDYVIRGVHGEYYPCKPDIFAETYERVESVDDGTNEVRLIDMNTLWECETCFHHKQNGCDTWCDTGESYRPAASKLKVIDPETLRPTGRWEDCDWVDYDGHGECVRYLHKGCVCTNCRNAFKKEFVLDPRVDYCPHCGAKMEG